MCLLPAVSRAAAGVSLPFTAALPGQTDRFPVFQRHCGACEGNAWAAPHAKVITQLQLDLGDPERDDT